MNVSIPYLKLGFLFHADRPARCLNCLKLRRIINAFQGYAIACRQNAVVLCTLQLWCGVVRWTQQNRCQWKKIGEREMAHTPTTPPLYTCINTKRLRPFLDNMTSRQQHPRYYFCLFNLLPSIFRCKTFCRLVPWTEPPRYQSCNQGLPATLTKRNKFYPRNRVC